MAYRGALIPSVKFPWLVQSFFEDSATNEKLSEKIERLIDSNQSHHDFPITIMDTFRIMLV
jgi:hypothetical protein